MGNHGEGATSWTKPKCKPQSDSPKTAKESFKLLMAVSANFGFKLASVDIHAAFVQSKVLDRDVYVEPPPDVKRLEDVFLNKLKF